MTGKRLTRGHYVFFAGLAMLFTGFLTLTRANAEATNAPAHVAPFLILGAYVVLAWGLLW